MNFIEVLNGFKKLEEPGQVFTLLDNKKLAEALAAWAMVPITWHRDVSTDETDPVKQWQWLWQKVRVDLKTFALLTGMPLEEAKATAERLIGLRLVYPDATINGHARAYLNMLVLQRLTKASKKISTSGRQS